MLLDVGAQTFISNIKENWISTMIRDHVEPNINISLTRNLLFDFYNWQWSHLLNGYHCIICGLKQTTEWMVNMNVTWLGFIFVLISFTHMHSIIWRGEFIWNWQSKVKVAEEFWMQMDRGWKVLKIGQFSWMSYVYHPLDNKTSIAIKIPPASTQVNM